MKSIIIFSVFMFPTLLWGQTVNHFDNLDSKWNVAKTYPAGNQQNPNFVATTTTVFGFQGDSLINNEQWFKLYSTNDSLFKNNLIYRGLTRSDNDLVLYRNTLNQLDTIYNFNLQMGDSVLFNLYGGMHPEWLPVIVIDSIQLNGEYYRRFKFAEPGISAFDWLDEEWIEGIGSIHGPLFPSIPVKFSEETPDSMLLTCSFSNNHQVWQNPFYLSCYVNKVLGIERPDILDFKIFPNPFSDRIHFETSIAEDFDLQLFNCLGQVVGEFNIPGTNETIDLSELPGGIYLMRISKQKSSGILKIVKKQ